MEYLNLYKYDRTLFLFDTTELLIPADGGSGEEHAAIQFYSRADYQGGDAVQIANINRFRLLSVREFNPFNNDVDIGSSSSRFRNLYLNNDALINGQYITVKPGVRINGGWLTSNGTETGWDSRYDNMSINIHYAQLQRCSLRGVQVIYPLDDNDVNLGLSSRRWSTIYAATFIFTLRQ